MHLFFQPPVQLGPPSKTGIKGGPVTKMASISEILDHLDQSILPGTSGARPWGEILYP